METRKSKVFTRKLIALFLSVLMALSCFTGALTAFAASIQTDKDYHDSNLAANFMAWAETTDEQTAEALLDYADLYIGDLMTGLMGSNHLYFSQNVVIDTITIDGYLDSIDGIYDLIDQLDGILGSYGNLVGGDVKNIDLSPIAGLTPATSGDYVISGCGKSYRQNYSAKELIMALAKTLYINSNDIAGKNVIGQFFKGELDLGSILTKALGNDVYGLLQGAFGMWDGYETNLVYNIVANVIITNTKWFTDDEKEAYYADLQGSSRTYAWNFDDVLFKALNQELLQKISVLVTYPNYVYESVDKKDADGNFVFDEEGNKVKEMQYVNDTSAYRKAENRIQDPKLVYSSEEQYADNVLLFVYDKNGDGTIQNVTDSNGNITVLEELTLEKDDNLFDFAFRALELAWETVLRDTLGLVHVNYNGHESVEGSVGSNYDNQFFYWMTGSSGNGWNYDDWTANYSAANVQAWAEAVYESYGCASADEFLTAVKRTYDYDRSVVADAQGNWHDIESTSLFNKLRYSPLADIYFDMQTGPINLYFEQTGITEISNFFDTAFTTYDSMVAAFNDALVAVTKVIFIDSDNIGYGTADNKPVTNLAVPTMATTGNTVDSATVASTLVSNCMAMFEYAANAADANILNPYYVNNNITTLAGNLSETNFEEAMIPLLVACLNTPALDWLVGMIHDEKWDSAKDAEGVAIVALEEYLSDILPDKDYSVLWTYDEDGYLVANSGQNLFDNAILPMARDALGFVISSAVPCRNTDGDEWDVYTTSPTDSTTIFDILNSVMCYYASTDNFGDNTTGKAVASLLGVVDANGNCLVSMSNDIWTNLDNIVNNLLPVIGTLQYGTTDKAGQASTRELIYDDIIGSIFDIGDVNEHTGKQGITTIIEEIFTIVTADPISNQGVDVMVYDNLVVPIVNNLFGARYTGQRYDKVIPYSYWYDQDTHADTKASSPFDSLVTTNTLAHYSASNDVTDSYDTGVFGILICNIYEAFGGASYSNEGTQGCWTGAMFAVEAVNNFIPSFVPELSDHELNAATAEIATPSQSGLTSGSAFTPTTLNITNNSMGLNRFYRDANGEVQRTPRYFINVTSVAVSSSNGSVSNITLGNATGVIAPEKTKRITISGSAPSEGVLYTFTIKYDIFKGEMNGTTLPSAPSTPLYEGLETTAYMYLTPEKDWAGTVYTRSSTNVPSSAGSVVDPYTSILEPDEAYESTSNNTTAYTQNIKFRSDKLVGTWLNDLIIPMSNPSVIKNYGLRIKNTTGAVTGSKYSVDGVFTYYTAGTQYYPVSNDAISDTLTSKTADDTTMAYVAIDKATGNILNFDLYDYYNPNDKTWYRGEVQESTGVYGGYTAAEITALDESITKADGFATRTHVAYTIQEALDNGRLAGVQRTASAFDSNGNPTDYYYDAVYLSFSDTTYATNILKGMYESSSKESVTMGTPTAGIYLAMPKTDIAKNSSVVCRWINYDGTTALSADDYDMPLCLYSSNGAGTGTTHIYIADDTGASTLTQAYNSNLNTISSYRATDFTDYDEDTLTSETYESMKAALSAAVKTISTPVNTSNATALGSTMIAQANTTQTTDTYGDEAYKVVTDGESLPGAIAANVTKYNGICYYNKEHTMPVYKHENLTDADVTTSGGKYYDPAGAEVVKVDGVWYLANTPLYETEWDTTTYSVPYLTKTSTQATDSNAKPLYEEISFVYRDAYGNKVTSKDDWSYKFAETATVIKPNDGNEYRGMYQRDIDNLAYWLEQLQSKVDTSIANRIVTEVSEDREGLNNVNYNVASYEKMVQIAKDAESLIWYVKTGAVDEKGNDIMQATTNKSSLQIDAAIAMYNEFKGYVISRGYIGDKLEQEISCATTPGYDDASNANVAATVYTYQDFDYTQTTDEETGAVTAATITSATATDAAYGAWVDGTLVNEGETVYTDDSWNAYVIALSSAIKAADAKSDVVSDVYTYKSNLQRAENNLTAVDATSNTITVSGKITIATNLDGSAGTVGIIGINVLDEAGNIVATSAADGTFTAEVPVGTTVLTISGPSTIDRTVTLSGTADITDVVIPVIICDYNKDLNVNETDILTFNLSYKNSANYNVYCDFNGDNIVDETDVLTLNVFYKNSIDYYNLSLD